MAAKQKQNEQDLKEVEIEKLNMLEEDDDDLDEASEIDSGSMLDNMTFAVKKEDKSYKGPTVDVFLPELPGGEDGVKVDQYEHVTIANERKETIYHIHRGETVSVPVAVYQVLKAKYPKI